MSETVFSTHIIYARKLMKVMALSVNLLCDLNILNFSFSYCTAVNK